MEPALDMRGTIFSPFATRKLCHHNVVRLAKALFPTRGAPKLYLSIRSPQRMDEMGIISVPERGICGIVRVPQAFLHTIQVI